MNPGESFEIKCYEYLKTHYATSDTHFAHQGGMDSTTSDIAVLKHNRVDFYMEAKDADAQSGQFVLLPDEDSRTFLFSPRNRSHSNEMTNIMIAYMNQDFDRYNRAGTAGEILDIDSGVFADWIVDHYRNKKVKYFISYGNDYVIFPIRQFTSYFDIIAKYRIKKSGSGDPAKRDFMTIKNRIVQLYPSASFSEDGKNYMHTYPNPS